MMQSHADFYTIHISMDLALNTRVFMANYQPRTMHISWKNKGIPRMWTDFVKTPLYTKKSATDHPHQEWFAGKPFGSPATKLTMELSPKTKELRPIGVQFNNYY